MVAVAVVTICSQRSGHHRVDTVDQYRRWQVVRQLGEEIQIMVAFFLVVDRRQLWWRRQVHKCHGRSVRFITDDLVDSGRKFLEINMGWLLT